MNAERKEWVRPELVILTRGRPEEAVLWLCKYDDAYSATEGPETLKNGCHVSAGSAGGCNACLYDVGS